MDAEATPGATDLSHEQRIGAALVPGPQPRPLRTTGTTCAGGPGVLRPRGFRRDGVPERAAAREWVPARRCPRARSGAHGRPAATPASTGWPPASRQSVLGTHQTAAVELLGVPTGLSTVDEELGWISLEIEPDGQATPVAVVLAEALVTAHQTLLAVAARAGTALRNIRNGGGTCTRVGRHIIHGS